jgi:AhpD family alkylhydroperoxidase
MRAGRSGPGSPRVFASAGEPVRELASLACRVRPLAEVYLRGRLDAAERERIMVAVSRVNACRGCTFVHQRWALRAGVTAEELDAIGLGDLAAFDPRSRAAVVYAAALAEHGFRRSPPKDIAAAAALQLTPADASAIEAVARLMALANLSANTASTALSSIRARVRRRRGCR